MSGRTFSEIPARVSAGIGHPRSTDDGLATEMVPAAAMYADDGRIAPGALCILADTAIGFAVVSGLPEEAGIVTSHLNIEFVRRVPSDATLLRCTGRLARADASYALGSGTILGPGDDEIAIATIGCVVVPRPPADGVTAVRGAGDDTTTPVPSSVDELLGCRVVSLTAERCEVSYTASAALSNLHSGVHGGMGVLMAERAMDRLVPASATADGGSKRLVALRAVYPRRIAADGDQIACIAETVHHGRRLTMVRATLHDQDGRTAVSVEGTYAATSATATSS